MLRFRLAPDNLKIGFMQLRSVTYPLSALLSLISVFAFLTFGLNYGIDFAGGTLMEMRAKQGQADLSSLRALGNKLEFGEVTSANVGRPFAIVLDNKVISGPRILGPITGGSGQISGRFTV